jgi:hypothetical protein
MVCPNEQLALFVSRIESDQTLSVLSPTDICRRCCFHKRGFLPDTSEITPQTFTLPTKDSGNPDLIFSPNNLCMGEESLCVLVVTFFFGLGCYTFVV